MRLLAADVFGSEARVAVFGRGRWPLKNCLGKIDVVWIDFGSTSDRPVHLKSDGLDRL